MPQGGKLGDWGERKAQYTPRFWVQVEFINFGGQSEATHAITA